MEQGTRWAVRGDHLRGRDDSAMPTLERCCHANSAHGAAQSPHAWHVGDRKAVSHAGGVVSRSLVADPSFFCAGVNFFFLITAIESNIRPAASAPLLQGGWWGVTRGLFKMGLPRPSPKMT